MISAQVRLESNLLAFSARLETVCQNLGAFIGLSGIQYTTLISIRHLHSERGVGVGALADHLSLSGACVTIEVGKLVKLGPVYPTERPTNGPGSTLIIVQTIAIGVLGAIIGGLILRFLLTIFGVFSGFVGAFLGAVLLIWLYQRYMAGR